MQGLRRRIQNRIKWASFKIAIVYLLVSAVWILTSDYLVFHLVPDYETARTVSIVKGWLFIGVTAALLYALINRNIAQITDSERAAQESERGYRELSDSITDVCFAVSPDLRFTYWNRAAESRTGIPHDSVIGKKVYEVFPNFLGDEGEQKLTEVLKNQKQERYQEKYPLDCTDCYFEIDIYPSKKGLLVFAKDITERKRTEQELKESFGKLKKTLNDTVNVLASVAEKRDPYIAGHEKRVADLAVAIAKRMELPDEDAEGIRVAAILHDIGKVSIPAEILNKPGPLSDIEYQIVKIYPQVSYDILKAIDFPWPVAEITREHQEKFNGSGYPRGLKNEQIIRGARIVGVSDFIDSLLSHRPYRSMFPMREVIEALKRGKGTLFEPDVVDAALEVLTARGAPVAP